MSTKQKYTVVSGEGVNGTVELTKPMTETGIKRRLTRERCGGDRWAKGYRRLNAHDTTWINVETGEAATFNKWDRMQ